MSGTFHVIWCPHVHCSVFCFSYGSAAEDASWLEHHAPACDGARFDRDTAATAERMHAEALWERVSRRWSAKGAALPSTQRSPGSEG